MQRLIFLLLLGVVPALASSSASARENPYHDRSDEQLTALAADWDSLDRHQRRALLTEMKVRMARNGKRGNVLHIRTERRYGRLIRQSDGRVIRIETQVVHVRPVSPEDLEARKSFGVGFEQRVARRGERHPARAGGSADPDIDADDQPSLDDVLKSLAPATRAPAVDRLPIYQVSDPES
jgi:hypothetical protein